MRLLMLYTQTNLATTTCNPLQLHDSAEVARFLEQATFGTTKDDITKLSATSGDDGSPDFANWVEHQLDSTSSGAGLSSHREFFRSRTNPRFEYPFRGGGAGPETACEMSSRWRKFAIHEHDGIPYGKSDISKWLHIKPVGNRYIWYVEGMARTSTTSLPYIKDKRGLDIHILRPEPSAYRISTGIWMVDNMKYSCVGCPIMICATSIPGLGCGYIENPKVDMVGILGTSRLLYSVVDLPPIMAGDGKMVPINNGPYLKSIEQFQQPNDEFYLNFPIDQSKCAGHPKTLMPQPTLLTLVPRDQHVEEATPPIFGKTTNKQTGQVEYMLFDPTLRFQENTVENPLPDGGGNMYSQSNGRVFCSNVKRSFMNEDHCK